MDTVKLFYPESTQITSHVIGVVPRARYKKIPHYLVEWEIEIMRIGATLVVIRSESANHLIEAGIITSILPIFTSVTRYGITDTLFYEPYILTFILGTPEHSQDVENYANKHEGHISVMGIFGHRQLITFNTRSNGPLYSHITAFRKMHIDAIPEFRKIPLYIDIINDGRGYTPTFQ
jgi:hypothetical protein